MKGDLNMTLGGVEGRGGQGQGRWFKVNVRVNSQVRFSGEVMVVVYGVVFTVWW